MERTEYQGIESAACILQAMHRARQVRQTYLHSIVTYRFLAASLTQAQLRRRRQIQAYILSRSNYFTASLIQVTLRTRRQRHVYLSSQTMTTTYLSDPLKGDIHPGTSSGKSYTRSQLLIERRRNSYPSPRRMYQTLCRLSATMPIALSGGVSSMTSRQTTTSRS